LEPFPHECADDQRSGDDSRAHHKDEARDMIRFVEKDIELAERWDA
jgi:hypothetical protein